MNGILQQVAVDDLDRNDARGGALAGGGVGGGLAAGLAACVGQTVAGAPSPTAPAALRFINMVIDPTTLGCTIFGGQSVDGAFLILQFNPAASGFLSIFPDALLPTWTLIDPPGGFVAVSPFGAGRSFGFTLRAVNGVEIRATLTVIPSGGNFTVQVVNLEVL